MSPFRRSVVAVALVVSALAACSKESDRWVGRYEVDRDELWKAWRDDIFRDQPDLLESMRDTVATIRFDLDVEADGTFKTSSLMLTDSLPEEQQKNAETAIDSSGTWKAVGDTITLTITERNGQSLEGTISGTYRDGVLRLNMGPGVPVVLRKRGSR